LNDGTVAHVGAYCWYNNNIANKPIYGGLYNQFSILNAHGLVYFTKGGVLQTGWRVPNKSIDIDNLVAFLGGNAVAGGKLKEAGILHWTAPNNGASNDVSFYGFGGGRRDVFGTFENFNTTGDFWSSEEYLPSPGNYWDLALQNVTTIAGQSTLAGGYGMSIRCVKDI
jgi:uncharacterized protein (TIGR02145 family)